MKRVLLVNPPIYDFSAFDFWLKPFGLLQVGGYLRRRFDLRLFDFLDRPHPRNAGEQRCRSDAWGRGKFPAQAIARPAALADIDRTYRRYGVPHRAFLQFLAEEGPFDFALIQTTMTYWYPGVGEVIQSLRAADRRTRIVLGGIYATICPEHARSLGADLVVSGRQLDPLWDLLDTEPDLEETPFWEGYPRQETGVIKLSDGCPFRCTYCSVPRLDPTFRRRDPDQTLRALRALAARGVRQLAFYDDALLFQPERMLLPFLDRLATEPSEVCFHTPNALNARFITPELARTLVRAGFRSFFLGYESDASNWQRATGGKVTAGEFESAVAALRAAGADPRGVFAYLIVGHPNGDAQQLEDSLRSAHRLGVRAMLSEFSPIPGTPDGERCRAFTDLDEPLNHNKTAFTHRFLGAERLQDLKHLCQSLNRTLPAGVE